MATKRPAPSSSSARPGPSAAKRPRLDVGSLIEALDVQNLWFPARVVEVKEEEVLVHFDGWTADWDEWLETDSTRLRAHRGWGTQKMPNDWQQDSIIEALDMEGKWYPAKVIFVSQNAVMVHYQGWSAKWDEWLDKSSGRLRERHSAVGVGQPTSKLSSTLMGSKHNETHDDVCALCEEVGELICCDGKCKRAFHVACIPSNNPPPSADHASARWVCSDCHCRRMRCFVCKEWGTVGEDVVSCGHKTCGKFYHPECLASSLQTFNAPLPAAPRLCQPVASRLAAAAAPAAEEAPAVATTAAGPRPPSRQASVASSGGGGGASLASGDNDDDDDDDGVEEEEEEEEEDVEAAAEEADAPWMPPEQQCAADDATEAGSVAGEATAAAAAASGAKAPRRRRRPPRGLLAWSNVGCARHWCSGCHTQQSTGYGKAMIHCVRCTTSFHRSCVPRTSLTMITHHTFLCHRCHHNSPRGLNAPDPALPSWMRGGADPFLEINGEGPSLHEFSTAKLGLREGKHNAEFEQPAELLQALRARELLPCNGFAPTPYQPLKRSVCVHKQPREALPASDSLSCSCTPYNGGCDERCQNRALQQECLPSLCLCGEACGNRPFARHHANPIPLQLFKTERKGWGVKVVTDVNEGELLVEYVGEVIDRESWEERKRQLSRFDHMYFMALNQNEIVDATRKGNIARFINHSCSPNLVVQKWYINRMPRLGLFAKEDIAAGTELSYNYSVKWFGDPDMAQRCYCDAPNCTGFLGPPPPQARRPIVVD